MTATKTKINTHDDVEITITAYDDGDICLVMTDPERNYNDGYGDRVVNSDLSREDVVKLINALKKILEAQ